MSKRSSSRVKSSSVNSHKSTAARASGDQDGSQGGGTAADRSTTGLSDPIGPMKLWIAAGLLGLFAWGYWPTLVDLVSQWQAIPDYSHGFLVVPIAIYFLYLRWDQRPPVQSPAPLLGLTLMMAAGAMRVVAARYYLEPVDGWSIPLWVAGVVALLWGARTLWWAAAPLAFLVFMVPLPYTLENMMAGPLQSISTKISTVVLQLMLFPAISQGNTIVVGQETLEVARACSGLRIFMGIAAMAFAFLLLCPRPWLTRVILLVAILPIALLANSTRIVATGILYQFGWSQMARDLSHDLAGWFMIPLALALFGLTLVYLDKLFVETEAVDAASLVRHQTRAS
jgi:exosortase